MLKLKVEREIERINNMKEIGRSRQVKRRLKLYQLPSINR